MYILSAFLAFSGALATHIEEFVAEIAVLPQSTDTLALPLPEQKTAQIPTPEIENTPEEPESETPEEIPEPTPAPKVVSAQEIQSALANVACSVTAHGKRRISTGSGVFIDPRGVVLTNAHVAQFLLLADTHEDIEAVCIIRTGDPATPRYEAELVYISPQWIRDHASLINNRAPVGSGARDFALLRVTESLEGSIPSTFPHLAPNQEEIDPDITDADVFVAGYPALVDENGTRSASQQVVAPSPVHRLYGFTRNFVDIIGIDSIGEDGKGSSGGPVVSQNGDVIGLITTQGGTTADGERMLRALTLGYISRAITQETNFTLESLLQSDLAVRADVFQQSLTSFLSDELSRELLEE